MPGKFQNKYRISSIENQNPFFRTSIPSKSIGGITGKINPMLHDNLSRIVRWYKGRTTFELHKIKPGFERQERFYETIISTEQSYQTIADYIINNPANWENDKFYYA
jgi:putative transposase